MTHPAMDQLQRLQELETNIRQLEADVKRIAPQVAQITADEEKRKALLGRMRERIATAQNERAAAELELKSADQKLTRLRAQMNRIASPKELAALEHETAASSTQVSSIEELILTGIEQEENLTRDLEQKTRAAERMSADAAAQKKRFEQLAAEKSQLAKDLREERITLRNQLPQDLRDMCDWLAKRHDGSLLTGLKGQACGGCGGILVPHIVLDVQQSKDLQQCNHCRRFLHP
jgi:uncharacterized protein